jgi:hypothetical protein
MTAVVVRTGACRMTITESGLGLTAGVAYEFNGYFVPRE